MNLLGFLPDMMARFDKAWLKYLTLYRKCFSFDVGTKSSCLIRFDEYVNKFKLDWRYIEWKDEINFEIIYIFVWANSETREDFCSYFHTNLFWSVKINQGKISQKINHPSTHDVLWLENKDWKR